MRAAKENHAAFTRHRVIVTSRQVAVEPVPHRNFLGRCLERRDPLGVRRWGKEDAAGENCGQIVSKGLEIAPVVSCAVVQTESEGLRRCYGFEHPLVLK